MKKDAAPINHEEFNRENKTNRYPVWKRLSVSEIETLLDDELNHDALAKKISALKSPCILMQGDVSSIEETERKLAKEKLSYPVWPWSPAVKKKAPILNEPGYQASATKNPAVNSPRVPSKERQVRQQLAQNIGSKEAFKKNSDCSTLLDICRQAAAKAVATEGETDRSVVEVLAGIVKLKRLVSTNPAAERDLNQAYKAAGIRITGRTANPFTPMVKLVFPKNAQKPATVSRNASVLRLAEEENIEPSGLAGFVRQNGGLAACANRAAEERRNAAGESSSTATAADEFVAACRRNAAMLKLPDGLGLPKRGPSVLLVEPTPKGGWSLLAWCEASPTMVRRFS